MDLTGADTPQMGPHVARPVVDRLAGAIDRDDGDLQNAMTTRRQTAGLDIDHGVALVGDRKGERGGIGNHTRHPTPRVSRSWVAGARPDGRDDAVRRQAVRGGWYERSRTPIGAATVKPAR